MVKKFGMDKALFVGGTGEENFYVDSIKPHVVFICGARGSGKSYTMGVLVEELARKNDSVASIVVDPVGVFWSMKSPNKVEKELELLKKWELEPQGFDNISVLVPVGAKNIPKQSYDGFFSLQPSELQASDWAFAFDVDRFSPAGLLIDNAVQKAGDNYSIDDLIRVISTDDDLKSKERGFSKQTRRGIVSRLESAKFWGVFSDKATPLEHMARAGKVTVLDISFLEEPVAALVVGIISRKALERRKVDSRNEALGKPSRFPPVWLFIDEAHVMVPKDHKTAASDSIIEYVKQGRRPGCSIVLATQQPSAINSEVLSQLDVMFVHQLVFSDDIKAVSKRMPAAMPKEWDVNFIRGLRTGQAIVGDRETTKVALVGARPRMSQHEGRSTLAVDRPKPVLDIPEPTPEEVLQEAETVNEMPVEKPEPRKKAQRRTIPMVRPKMGLEAAEELASKQLKRFLFMKREKFDVKMKVYWPFWVVKGVSIEGGTEFLFDSILGEIEGSKGLQRMLDLSPMAARIMSGPGTLEQLAKRAGAESRTVKLQLNKLVKLGLVRVSKKGDRKEYVPRLQFPKKIREFRRKVAELSPEGRIMKPVFEPDKKFFRFISVKPTGRDLVYVPYALFRTDKKKQIWVNLATGDVEDRKIRLRI
jgi:hypothetical protein